jgi:preprotein translocase subunit SecF
MINIISKRYIFFVLSLLIIIPGLLILFILGLQDNLPLAIDFTGGSLIEVSIGTESINYQDEIIEIYEYYGVEDVQIQPTDKNSIIIRSSFLDDDQQSAVKDEIVSQFSDQEVQFLRFDNVGPVIGQEVATRAAMAVGFAALIVVLYITFAFRGIQNASRYGICAVIAMVHDVCLVLSITAVGSILFSWQIDALFLTALLTVIGFSVQDKVVVFDRIRENSSIYKKLNFETLVNHSVVQTLQRSINTQLMTVEFMLLALVLFGGQTLREFALVLLVGLLSGTYSSIFIAAPILVVWENREWRNWFHKKAISTA